MSKVSDEKPWKCSGCGSTLYARIDEMQPDRSFGPGNNVRCVECKRIHYFPRAALEAVSSIHEAEAVGGNGELDAGINYAIERLCEILDVDPKSISWDAATETMDGDVSSVICNVLIAAYGEEWSSKPETTARILSCLSHTAGEIEAGGEVERLTRERDQAQGIAQTLLAAAEADLALMQDTAQTVLSLQSRAEAADKRKAELTEQAGKCASLLEVLAEESENRGDTASWSMASVMAADTRTALSTHSGDKL